MLTLEQARTIITAARALGHARGYAPLSIAVLDSGGHLTAFEREDGSSTQRFAIAHGKAHGAMRLRIHIHEQDFLARVGKSAAEIYGYRRLTTTTFLIDNRYGLHCFSPASKTDSPKNLVFSYKMVF